MQIILTVHPVSTHSRPKAAGQQGARLASAHIVSTHSRPKAAGRTQSEVIQQITVSTHSRPKAAGFNRFNAFCFLLVSTHSRPKAAGFDDHSTQACQPGFNSQPPEGGWVLIRSQVNHRWTTFQLTAARRRLGTNSA